MMVRALIGGCLLVVLMLRPDGAAAQTAATPDQNANTGNDLFRPPPNLFQMMYDYKTAPGNGSTPGSTRDVTTQTLNLRMDHSLDLAPLWILALRADVPPSFFLRLDVQATSFAFTYSKPVSGSNADPPHSAPPSNPGNTTVSRSVPIGMNCPSLRNVRN